MNFYNTSNASAELAAVEQMSLRQAYGLKRMA